MSDSPKYSTPSLREQEERRLRAERERLDCEENARRQAEAERKRQERLEQLRVLEGLRTKRRAALEALAAIEGEVQALHSDVVTMRWKHEDVNAIGAALIQTVKLIEAGAFDEAMAQISVLIKQINSAISEAQKRQLAEDRRQYIVNGIITVLRQMGFIISADSPRQGDASKPTSDILLSARRLGGGAVAVSVPLEGDVWYDVNGYPKRKEASIDGSVIATCDEAETELRKLHAILACDFGIKMSDLTWAGKPIRIDKHVEALPGSGSYDHKRK